MRNLLAVEDSIDFHEVGAALFRGLGVDVVRFSDSLAASRFLRTRSTAVIVTDYEMP